MKKLNEHAALKVIRKLITEALDSEDDLNSIEVGDVVDVDSDEMGTVSVRVIELVDDVNAHAGEPDPRNPGDFTGPGFVGEIDPESGESGTLVFSLNQVVPGSKAKGYFPRDIDDMHEAVNVSNNHSTADMSNQELRSAASDIWQRYRNGGRPDEREREIFTHAYWAGVLPRDPNYGDLGQWVEDGFPSM